MKINLPLFILVLIGLPAPAAPVDPAVFPTPVRVACVGASITQGAGAAPGKSYPEQLQALLGTKWQVKNFGVSGRTLLKHGDHPYWNEKAFTAAHEYQPNVVIILLGSNDTKPANWVHSAEFYTDYRDLVESFKKLSSKPRVFVCRLPPVPAPGNYGINEKNLDIELGWIDKVAADEDVDLIDMHTPLLNHPNLQPDHVHPNTEGAAILAQTAAAALTGKLASTQ